jgi:hypothetical protein
VTRRQHRYTIRTPDGDLSRIDHTLARSNSVGNAIVYDPDA